MAEKCRIEFYFRAEELNQLLKDNPDAKAVIVSQEIRKEKPKGMESFINVTHIRARVHGKLSGTTESAKLMEGGDEPPPEEGIDGCPYPPGCTP
jgi:hypothetical protein